jgi:hypothetical protein
MIIKDISTEAWREYDFGGRVYRIVGGTELHYTDEGTTHRVVSVNDGVTITHCVPKPGVVGCVLRWQGKDGGADVQF